MFISRFVTYIIPDNLDLDLRTLRAIRVLRPLKLVSGIPSKSPTDFRCHHQTPVGLLDGDFVDVPLEIPRAMLIDIFEAVERKWPPNLFACFPLLLSLSRSLLFSAPYPLL